MAALRPSAREMPWCALARVTRVLRLCLAAACIWPSTCSVVATLTSARTIRNALSAQALATVTCSTCTHGHAQWHDLQTSRNAQRARSPRASLCIAHRSFTWSAEKPLRHHCAMCLFAIAGSHSSQQSNVGEPGQLQSAARKQLTSSATSSPFGAFDYAPCPNGRRSAQKVHCPRLSRCAVCVRLALQHTPHVSPAPTPHPA